MHSLRAQRDFERGIDGDQHWRQGNMRHFRTQDLCIPYHFYGVARLRRANARRRGKNDHGQYGRSAEQRSQHGPATQPRRRELWLDAWRRGGNGTRHFPFAYPQ